MSLQGILNYLYETPQEVFKQCSILSMTLNPYLAQPYVALVIRYMRYVLKSRLFIQAQISLQFI